MAAVIQESGGTAFDTREDADGRTDQVPVLMELLRHPNLATSLRAVEKLHSTVWRGGAVYEITPVVVPGLAAVVTDPERPDRLRCLTAFLLAAIGSADAYVLPDDHLRRPAWWAASGPLHDLDPDLALKCRAAVEQEIDGLLADLGEASSLLMCGLVAAAAAAHHTVDARSLVGVVASALWVDPRLGAAAQVLMELVEQDGDVSSFTIRRAAFADSGTIDLLGTLDGVPLREQGIKVVDHLSSRAARALLG